MRIGGILMHITSLPSAGGIGDLGKEAFAFADFLHAGGMHVWQMLPVCPTGYGESPYQAPSAFAGNELMISLEKLREQGLLSYEDSELSTPSCPSLVDFDTVRKEKTALLRRAWKQSGSLLAQQVEAFAQEHSWVRDYALYAALKIHFGNVMWSRWPDAGIRNHQKKSVQKYESQLKEEINYHAFCQFLFDRQWTELKQYCNAQGILLLGDMPIYVAEDSADTWTHPEVFQLNRSRLPKRVAGVPPDAFSDDGQLWGNPLYRWHSLYFHRYSWWVERMKSMASRFDMVRIDHFIGFANYYSIPYGAPNARNGKWVIGPGKRLFKKLKKEIPGMNIVAENLGEINARVRKLLAWCEYPGMTILAYGFDGNPSENEHFPANYIENNVAYTGTHDNDPIRGWVETAPAAALNRARETLGFQHPEEAPWAFIRCVFASPCRMAIVPMQDVLGLDSTARMNYPGTVGGNWRWRMIPGAASPALAEKLFQLCRETNRTEYKED